MASIYVLLNLAFSLLSVINSRYCLDHFHSNYRTFCCFLFHFSGCPKGSSYVEENSIVSPCDGKVVVIEETIDPEYFKDKRLQISIFMSPAKCSREQEPGFRGSAVQPASQGEIFSSLGSEIVYG